LRIAPYSTHPEPLSRWQKLAVALAVLTFAAFMVAGVALIVLEGAGR
jgi:hypothetical protein